MSWTFELSYISITSVLFYVLRVLFFSFVLFVLLFSAVFSRSGSLLCSFWFPRSGCLPCFRNLFYFVRFVLGFSTSRLFNAELTALSEFSRSRSQVHIKFFYSSESLNKCVTLCLENKNFLKMNLLNILREGKERCRVWCVTYEHMVQYGAARGPLYKLTLTSADIFTGP